MSNYSGMYLTWYFDNKKKGTHRRLNSSLSNQRLSKVFIKKEFKMHLLSNDKGSTKFPVGCLENCNKRKNIFLSIQTKGNTETHAITPD